MALSLRPMLRALALVASLGIVAGPPWGLLLPAPAPSEAAASSSPSVPPLIAASSLAPSSEVTAATSPPPTVPVAVSPAATPGQTATALAAGIYGSGLGADSLGNTQVGGTNVSPSSRTSYRFRADHAGPLESLRFYLEDGPGYSGGNGGTLEVTVQEDDGGKAHLPSGVVLARETFKPGNPMTDHLRSLTFSAPPSLSAGAIYHVVFRNTDPSPARNFVSVNSLVLLGSSAPGGQPRSSETDWGQLLYDGSAWTPRTGHTPILALTYADGASQGVGYMEVWIRAPKLISGAAAVRETFTVGSLGHSATVVWIRLARERGVDPLTIRLETGDGALIDVATVPAQVVGTSQTWVIAVFGSQPVLQPGQAYRLVLSAPATSRYSTFAIRKGIAYRFPSTTFFADGWAQYTTGGDWRGFDQPGGTANSSEGDLQFYFG